MDLGNRLGPWDWHERFEIDSHIHPDAFEEMSIRRGRSVYYGIHTYIRPHEQWTIKYAIIDWMGGW